MTNSADGVAEAEHIDVACRPMGAARPYDEERRALQDEAIADLALADAMEKSFARGGLAQALA